jgi:hypothetical protein
VVAIAMLCAPSAPGGPERWRFLQLQERQDSAPPIPLCERVIASPEVFGAALVSMGLLGVAVGLVIEAREAFWLYRRRYARRWREIRPELATLALRPPTDLRGRGWRYELAVNPVAVRRCMSRPFDAPTPGSTGQPEWVAQELMHDEWGWDLDHRDTVLALDPGDEHLAAATELFDVRVARPSLALSEQLFREESGEIADRGYRVLRFEWNDAARAWGTELFVPLERGAEAVDWVLERNIALGYGHEDRLVNPFAVRVVPSRSGLLCPSRLGEGRTACAVELSVPVRSGERKNARQRAVMVRWAAAFLEASDARGWGGRLHWGLVNDPFDGARLDAAYGEAAAVFREVLLAFDRRGRFDTALGRQLGLSAWREAHRDRGSTFDWVA